MASNNTSLHKAHGLGQSIWYDNMRRGLLRSGALAELIARGVRGVTSNPTIFEKAIVHSSDYEEALRRLVGEGRSTIEIYEDLALEDIGGACDLMRALYDESDAVDGRVSLEVLPELASSTERTIAEGLRLAKALGRPNVMIKVPATPEGIPAIRALTAHGISVNVTLVFSLLQYEEVVEAYLAGLEERRRAGGSFAGMTSVASFFVSRVDTVCDRLLVAKATTASSNEGARCESLRGKLGIANAKLAYEIYQRTIASPRWRELAAAGARPQRLLWASTGTKDPRYPDTYYVDALMGPDTVDTVPPATLDAYLDHGQPVSQLANDIEGARQTVAAFNAMGFDLGRVCHGLLTDGVNSFSTSMSSLLAAIDGRRAALSERSSGRQQAALPDPLRLAVDAEVARLKGKNALPRLWDSDPTLFSSDLSHEKSIKSRLGWLRSPTLMASKAAELTAFAAEIKAAGFTDAVLLGMGGSSLCPEVLSRVYATAASGIRLHVLDNTDPAAVREIDGLIAGKQTLFIVASKSGGTIEIQAFERHYWQQTLTAAGGDIVAAGARFVAITDPATRLGQLAEEKHYRKTFINPADIGGRYSALSYFGMVPAALLGAPVDRLAGTGVAFAAASGPAVPAEESPGLWLGAALGAAAKAGRDKLTLVISPPLPAWARGSSSWSPSRPARTARGSSPSTWSRSAPPASTPRTGSSCTSATPRTRSRSGRSPRWSRRGTRSSASPSTAARRSGASSSAGRSPPRSRARRWR